MTEINITYRLRNDGREITETLMCRNVFYVKFGWAGETYFAQLHISPSVTSHHFTATIVSDSAQEGAIRKTTMADICSVKSFANTVFEPQNMVQALAAAVEKEIRTGYEESESVRMFFATRMRSFLSWLENNPED